MKKNRFFTQLRFCGFALLGIGALILCSCADDGYNDDERWSSTVKNTQLSSPDAANIKVTASADGKRQTLSWPVVNGASGYLVSFYDPNASDSIVADSIVDGCAITVSREEDMNYEFSIRTLGDTKNNNASAETPTLFRISTFTATFATIPSGTDLNEYFTENPVPTDSIGINLNYDLEAGGEYFVSGKLDFDANSVTLRTNSKSNPALITYTSEESCIYFAAPFCVKYLAFDCAGMSSTHGAFGFSVETTAEVNPDRGFVIFDGNVAFVNSTFKNVNGYFFSNHKSQKIAAIQFLIDNCVVEMTPSSNLSGGVIWTNKGGHINDLTISNSTFYNLSEFDIKYFYQAGMYRAKDIGYGGAGTDQGGPGNSVTYKNSTFYRLGWNGGQWGNYNGMNGKADSYWTMTDCIFYACSQSGGVPRRFLHGKQNQKTATFANNTYMQADGTFDPVTNYDNSGTQIEEDPLFANPTEGDFHISGPKQVALKTGDPRWFE